MIVDDDDDDDDGDDDVDDDDVDDCVASRLPSSVRVRTRRSCSH